MKPLLLIGREFEDALRNSTFLLVLIGPVLCSILFVQVSSRGDFARPQLGIVGSVVEGLGLVLSTSDSVKVFPLGTEVEAQSALREGRVDGYVILSSQLSEDIASGELPTLRLLVSDANSVRASLLARALEEGGRTVAAQDLPLDVSVEGADFEGVGVSWKQGLLPSWIVFTAMSALMLCSASVIEEKEQRTLLGVLTAPVSMVELWVGKVGAGAILALLSTLAVLLGNAVIPSLLLLIHLAIGCLCFAALGVLVGLLCANQSAANAATSTLFMVIYIPLALQDLSEVLTRAASLSPAFYLQRGTRSMLAGQTLSGWQDLAVLALSLLLLAGLGLWAIHRSKSLLPEG